MRSWLKLIFGVVIYYGGGFFLLRFINNLMGKRLTIVTYHRVAEPNENKTSLPFLFVSKDKFEKQIRFFKKHYHIINFQQLNTLKNNSKIPWNSLIVTFDDGYEDVYFNAFPSLRNLSIGATVFLVTGAIENGQKPFWWDRAYYYFTQLGDKNSVGVIKNFDISHEKLLRKFDQNRSQFFKIMNKLDSEKIEMMLDEIQCKYDLSDDNLLADNMLLSKDQIEEMSETIEFGSHSCNHINILNLDHDMLGYEIQNSRVILEKMIGKLVHVFSYPAGNVSEDVKKIVENAGYEFAVTTEVGINDMKDLFRLKRINIWEGTILPMGEPFSKGYFAYKLLGL